MVLYTFETGDTDGAVRCNQVRTNSDGFVEDTETFMLILQAVSPEDDIFISLSEAALRVSDSPLDSKLNY